MTTARSPADACCAPTVRPEIDDRAAEALARTARALGDPIRLQLLDVLRRHGGTVCVCELTPLFAVSQPTVSHHLKVLRTAGLVDSERRGIWAYYRVLPEGLAALTGWLGAGAGTAATGDDDER